MTGTSRCRSCGAPLRWATSKSGRAMPLDAEPARAAGSKLHKSHFATCPNAKGHRAKP